METRCVYHAGINHDRPYCGLHPLFMEQPSGIAAINMSRGPRTPAKYIHRIAGGIDGAGTAGALGGECPHGCNAGPRRSRGRGAQGSGTGRLGQRASRSSSKAAATRKQLWRSRTKSAPSAAWRRSELRTRKIPCRTADAWLRCLVRALRRNSRRKRGGLGACFDVAPYEACDRKPTARIALLFWAALRTPRPLYPATSAKPRWRSRQMGSGRSRDSPNCAAMASIIPHWLRSRRRSRQLPERRAQSAADVAALIGQTASSTARASTARRAALKRALDAAERVLGKEHPDTLTKREQSGAAV